MLPSGAIDSVVRRPHGAIPWQAGAPTSRHRSSLRRQDCPVRPRDPRTSASPKWVTELTPGNEPPWTRALLDRPEINADGTVERTWDNYPSSSGAVRRRVPYEAGGPCRRRRGCAGSCLAEHGPLRWAQKLAEMVDLVGVGRVAPPGQLRVGRRVLLRADVGVEIVESPQVDDLGPVAERDEVRAEQADAALFGADGLAGVPQRAQVGVGLGGGEVDDLLQHDGGAQPLLDHLVERRAIAGRDEHTVEPSGADGVELLRDLAEQAVGVEVVREPSPVRHLPEPDDLGPLPGRPYRHPVGDVAHGRAVGVGASDDL